MNLSEEVLKEWKILKDKLISEKATKKEVDELQRQAFHQKTIRILDLEEEASEAESKFKSFCFELTEVINLFILGRYHLVGREVEEMEKKYLFQETATSSEPSSQLIVKGDFLSLFALLKDLGDKLSDSDSGPTIDEVD